MVAVVAFALSCTAEGGGLPDHGGDGTYQIEIDLPDEVVYGVTVTDTIPRGMIYEEGSLEVKGIPVRPRETVGSPNDGSKSIHVQWIFGDIDNTAGEKITLEFRMAVSNSDENRDGTIIDENRVHLLWMDGDGRRHSVSGSSEPVKLVEPRLNVEGQGTPDSGEPGSSTRYTLSVYHRPDSHAGAFDLDVAVRVPGGMTYLRGSARIVSGPPGTTDDSNTPGIRWHFDEADLSWDDANRIIVEYNASVDDSARPDVNLVSRARVTWSSVPGESKEERVYSAEARSQFKVTHGGPRLKISAMRMDDQGVDVLAGETLEYLIVFKNTGKSNATGLVLEGAYDQGIYFNQSDPSPDNSPDNDQWSDPAPLGPGESRAVRVALDVDGNLATGRLIENRFTAICNETGPVSCTAGAAVICERKAEMELDVSAPEEAASVQESVTFTYTLRNTGEAPLYDIVLEDSFGRVPLKRASLPPGEEETAQSIHVVTGADLPGPLVNEAEAKARYSSAAGPRHDGDVLSKMRSKIDISQIYLAVAANKSSAEPGDRINYTYTVANNGSSRLQIKSLAAEMTPEIFPRPEGIALVPGGWAALNGTYIILDDDKNPLINNATVKALDPWGHEVAASAYATVNVSDDSLDPPDEIPDDDRTLWISKAANNTNPLPGECVLYSITYGNSLDINADDVVIMDRLPDVEYISSSPTPQAVNGNLLVWSPGDLAGEETGRIQVMVKVPESQRISYGEESEVRGSGYVYRRTYMKAEGDGGIIVNYANITGSYLGGSFVVRDSSTAAIAVRKTAGAQIRTRVHGSGNFNETLSIQMSTAPREILMEREASEDLEQTPFSLPGNRTINYISPWADSICLKNYMRNEEISESYLFAESLERYNDLVADENQTVFTTRSEMIGGRSGIRYVKNSPNTTRRAEEIDEGYHGNFSLEGRLMSYGAETNYTRSTDGKGFVSSDKRVASSLRSFEHGSGSYTSEEVFNGHEVRKNISMTYEPEGVDAGGQNINYSSRWSEGMIARDDSLNSMIEMTISEADYIDMRAGMTQSSLDVHGDWKGVASLEAEERDAVTGNDVGIEEIYIGRYGMRMTLSMGRGPTFPYPHINVTKTAVRLDESTVLFMINVINDGNETLGPVMVEDLLPEGVAFINSSLLPDSTDGDDGDDGNDGNDGNVSWTIQTMPMGAIRTINLTAEIDDPEAEIINTAVATGYSIKDGDMVKDVDSCEITLEWLSCEVVNTGAGNVSSTAGCRDCTEPPGTGSTSWLWNGWASGFDDETSQENSRWKCPEDGSLCPL